MEHEYGEFAAEIEKLGISETEEDKAIENPTITIKQQQKRSKNASKIITQTAPLFQNKPLRQIKVQKTVFKSPSKKKEVVLLDTPSSK